MKPLNGSFTGAHILSVDQFSASDVDIVFKKAVEYRDLLQKGTVISELAGKILCALFYEPSSRTFGSFITSMQRLGGGFIPIQGVQFSSVVKGETLEDTIRVFGSYADAIALRHSETGAAEHAAAVSSVPIINAGDGVGEHPTQALLDLFTIKDKMGTLEGLQIAMVGDLKYGRTVHSLSKILSLYKNSTLYFVEPKDSPMPPHIEKLVVSRGVTTHRVASLEDIIGTIDVLYMTRVQKERMEKSVYDKLKGQFILTGTLASAMKKNSIIMHPLPRIDEITPDVDANPRAVYLTDEMRNGMYVRMALLGLILKR